ncbi:hypothetical protein PRZ48_008595 [Zasmidium cellare]|uniref:Uncharacterized protein n=1 Tax=Zasmidium cellare TaxID=395010 RepID=A0ABR0EGP6_ZASCE|nr:hypothetical protein PRZ48_008595 [Zasmidium cellare]
MFRSDRALTDLLCWHMLAIATAHFEWAERKSAEPPLRVLERAFKTFPVQRPLIPLKTFVSKIMEDRTLPPYPKELFDLFLDLRRKMHDGVFLKERLAKDLLWHPTTPDADPLLRYLQGDPSVYATMWQAPKPALSSIGSSILRACYILEHQGRIEDASWLKSMLESKFPEVWHKFDTIWKAMEKDPKLEGIRQRGKSQTT